MNEEKLIDEFEAEVLPKIKDDLIKVLDYFEKNELPSAYSACLQTYVTKFLSLSPKPWEEHCDDYGIKVDFKEIKESIEKIKSLDSYIENFS